MSLHLSVFTELRAVMDCVLVVNRTGVTFGAGSALRLCHWPDGTRWPVIPFPALQLGLPSGVHLTEGTPSTPTDAVIYYINGHRIGIRFPGEDVVRLSLGDRVHLRFRASHRRGAFTRLRWLDGQLRVFFQVSSSGSSSATRSSIRRVRIRGRRSRVHVL